MRLPYRHRLARHLRRLRRRAHLSQREWAERAGVSRRTVQRAENGTVVPSPETIDALEDAADGCILEDLDAVSTRRP